MSVAVFFPGMLLHCQGCFHCSKYCFLTLHLVKKKKKNYSFCNALLWCQLLWKFLMFSTNLSPSLTACRAWSVNLFAYFFCCIVRLCTAVSPMGDDRLESESVTFRSSTPGLLFRGEYRFSTRSESWCWMNWSDLVLKAADPSINSPKHWALMVLGLEPCWCCIRN